jgi:hypothetical protein
VDHSAARKITSVEALPCRRELRLRVRRKRALRALVPVTRVVEIAFQHVHDAVQPRRALGLVLLHDRMRRLPVAALEQRQRRSFASAFNAVLG